MDILELIIYWQKGYLNAWETTGILYKNKRYSDCLFYCHLTLEKLLKALVVQQQKQHAPFIHDLAILARKAGLELTLEQIDYLEHITTFNISGRYADYKTNFFKKFNNKVAANQYYTITKDLILCLKKNLPKN